MKLVIFIILSFTQAAFADGLCDNFPKAKSVKVSCVPAEIKGLKIDTNVRKLVPTIFARLHGESFYPYGYDNRAKALPNEEMSVRLAKAVGVRPSWGAPNLAIWHKARSRAKAFGVTGLTYLGRKEVEFFIGYRLTQEDYQDVGLVKVDKIKAFQYRGVSVTQTIQTLNDDANKATKKVFASYRSVTAGSYGKTTMNELPYLVLQFTIDPKVTQDELAYYLQTLRNAAENKG